MTSQLTDDKLQQFHADGYTFLPEFFNQREVAAMRADLERLQADGAFRNVVRGDDGVEHEKQNLQICPLSAVSELAKALPYQPKVIDLISKLITTDTDPNLQLHLDQVFLKPARHGSGTNWHQDNAYFGASDPMRGTAFWIAVHDATVANGTIRVIPGMQHEKLEHTRDPASDHHIRCFPPEEKAVHIELPAGGVAVFAYGTPHATGANNTDADRAGMAYHFLTRNAYAEKTGDTGLVEKYLTGPDALDPPADWETEVAKLV